MLLARLRDQDGVLRRGDRSDDSPADTELASQFHAAAIRERCPSEVSPDDSADVGAQRCRRRRRGSRKQGLWSEMWFKRATSWDEHLSCHPDIIATMFRDFRDSGWLQMQKTNFAIS